MHIVRMTGRERRGPPPAVRPIDCDKATHRAGDGSSFIALATLALPAILLSGCATPACEEWGTRAETVRVCNAKYAQCNYQEQSVPYCLGQGGQRTAAPAARRAREPAPPRPQPEESRETPAPEKIAQPAPVPPRPEPQRGTAVPEKIAQPAPPAAQAKEDRRTPAGDQTGAPNLNRFWRSLYSASKYSGLRYGKLRRVTLDPATTPASSARVMAALRKNVRTVVNMEVASDRRNTPMDHRLTAVVYEAHDPEAAVALYTAIVRDEWRARKQAQPGVNFVVVNAGDKNKPDPIGQRMHLQRGPYVVEVREWKSVYRDAKGKPIPGKQFRHSRPISPEVVVRAVTRTFPAE